jgi:hypothetical protein
MKKELSSRSVFLLDGSEGTGVEMFRQGPSLPAEATTQPKGQGAGAQ